MPPQAPRTPATPGPRDWKKIVDESGGLRKFVPSELLPAIKEWQEKRLAFNKAVNEIAKKEQDISLLFTTLIHDVRLAYEKAGIEDVWSMDIGIETEALKDGEYVINLTPNQK